MAAPISRLPELPNEILEQILLYLPGQDIIKAESISQHFRDLAHSSPALQHRRELFTVGLTDNPHNPCDLKEGRRLCKEYADRWSDATILTKSLREMPLEHRLSGWGDAVVLGRNFLAIPSRQSDNIDIVHIPPALSQKSTERWSIPKFPFEVGRYAAYPPKNVLAVAEKNEGFIRIHLFNLLDGSPYRQPPSNGIVWTLPSGIEAIIQDFAVSNSRLMMHAYFFGPSMPNRGREWRVVVWDWETGDLVLDRSSADRSGFIRLNSQIAFLDEFRIMVGFWHDPPSIPEIVVFNTFFPQDHPRNLRRFRLPPKCSQRSVRVHLDRDRSLGGVNRDGPLIIDPTQAILVMELWPRGTKPHVFIILRTQHLIECACSVQTEVQIPWDEWGRSAVIMEVPIGGLGSPTFIHGARMLAVHYARGDQEGHHRIHVFDFGRRGSPALPLSDEGDGGVKKKAEYKDGRSRAFEEGDGMGAWGVQSLGDSLVFRAGAPSTHAVYVLRVLDMI